MIRLTTDVKSSDLAANMQLAFQADQAVTHQLEANGDVIIAGWFTTEMVNSLDQIVKADSFDWDEGLSLFNGRILGFHDSRSTPVGVVEGDVEIISGKGLRGTVRIFKENADLFMRGIAEGVLQFFSIGFNVLTWEFDEETDIVTFTKCRLLEVSIVNSPANAEAEFMVVTNDVGTQLRTFKKPETIRKHAMPGTTETTALTPEAINAMGSALKLDDFRSEADKQAENQKKQGVAMHALQEEFNSFKDGTITKVDFVDRMKKINTDLETINNDLEKARTQIQMQGERLVYNDYRTMLGDRCNWLYHEDGRDFSELDYKGHALFQLPIDYNNFDRGQELKNLRNLHDAVVLSHALGRHRHSVYNLRNSLLFKQLQKGVATFDKDLGDAMMGHAMAGGNTGFGAEWLPEEMSAEFNELLRIQPTLSSRFQTWNMPKGASAKFPFQNGKAQVFKGSEALVDNANQARKTNIATGQKVFTPFPFIAALLSSQELQEDSIVELVSFIRMELATASLEALDSAISNGDDAATHMDNAGGASNWATYNVETGFDGLRRQGATDAQSDTGGTVNSLSIDDMLAIKTAMGVAGQSNPSDMIWVTGIKGKTQIKLALLAEGDLLQTPVAITGLLPTIDGSDVVISEQYFEDQDDDGFGHATAGSGAHTSICAVHTPSWRIGQRRGVTVEVGKDILTQQLQFVSTARWDFGKISGSSILPVGVGIKVQHT